MEGNKLCQNCKVNHAVRSFEGEKGREFYCLDCYSRLFLDESGESLDACPYCGMSLSEAKSGKLVGCAHCYRAMQSGLYPMVKKMQGGRAHTGKTPPLEGEFDPYDSESPLAKSYRERVIFEARYERQCRELQIIIDNLKAAGRFEDAKGYAEKLSAMKSREAIEEDFVWRTRPNLSKQS